MIKLKKQVILFFTILSLIILVGCAKQTAPLDTEQKESQTTGNQQTHAGQDTENQIVEEEQEETDNPALEALQSAKDVMESIGSLAYTSFSQSNTTNLNPDNPDTLIEYTYTSDDYGVLQREPSIAYTRNHNISGEYEQIDEVSFNEISAHHTFSDYYVSKEQGIYYQYDDVGEWFKGGEVSAAFKTMGHVEGLIDLFMQHPDQLVIKENEREEEESEGVVYETFYTISLDLSTEQFVEIVPTLLSSFFTGTYDRLMAYEDQTFMLISKDLASHNLSLTLDSDYVLVAFDTDFSAKLLDGSTGEEYHYNHSLYFFNYNAFEDEDALVIPEEVLLGAAE